MKPKMVYRIVNRETEQHQGVYSRACHDDYDFDSVERAKSSNFHDIYQDRYKYKINKYKVTYTLIKDDCEGPPRKKSKKQLAKEAEYPSIIDRVNDLMIDALRKGNHDK